MSRSFSRVLGCEAISEHEEISAETPITTEESKQRWITAFNLAADTYDTPPLRFFDLNAQALIREARIPKGAHVLDVATGTGKAALLSASLVGPRGRVIGIDLAGSMLERARRKAGDLPIEFAEMDAESLQFPGETFDVVLCSFGIFFHADKVRAMGEMRRVLRPGGRIAFSWWAKSAFAPMLEAFQTRLQRLGVPRAAAPGEPWMALNEPEHLLTLMDKAALRDCRVIIERTGYYLKNTDEWWTLMWGSVYRGALTRLSPDDLARFRAETLLDTERLRTNQGIWLDATALIGVGIR